MVAFGLFWVLAFFAALLAVFSPLLKGPQDVRQQAASDQGTVEVTTTSASVFPAAKQAGMIEFAVNTHGLNIDGVQLAFDLESSEVLGNAVLTAINGYQIIYQSVDPNDYHLYNVRVVVTKGVGTSINTTSPQPFLQLSITPESNAQITLTPDNGLSKANVSNTNPPDDELKTLQPVTFAVGEDASPAPNTCGCDLHNVTMDNCTTPNVATCTGNFSCQCVAPSASPSASPSTSPSASPSASPTASPSTSPSSSPTVPPSPEACNASTTQAQCTRTDCQWYACTSVCRNAGTPTASVCESRANITNTTSCLSSSTTGNVAQLNWNGFEVTALAISTNADMSGATTLNGPFSSNTVNLPGVFTNANYSIAPGTTYYVRYTATDGSTYIKTFMIPRCGTNTQSCNGNCSSNADCANNLMCSGGRCRRPDNTGSDTCAAPSSGTSGSGLQRSCNQYCADSTECASGYTCWYNRCRRPNNVDSTTCAAITTTVVQAMSRACNQTCSSNAQCATNLRCVSGRCRLATNPSNPSCLYGSNTEIGVGGPTKGEEIFVPTPTPTATPSPSLSPSPSVRPSSTPRPSPSATPVPARSALEEIMENLQGRGLTLPVIALGLGLLLLIIGILIALFSGRSSNSQRRPPVSGRSPVQTTYERNLEERIQALRQQHAQITQPGAAPMAGAGQPPSARPPQVPLPPRPPAPPPGTHAK
jgi:hypothetical protein